MRRPPPPPPPGSAPPLAEQLALMEAMAAARDSVGPCTQPSRALWWLWRLTGKRFRALAPWWRR